MQIYHRTPKILMRPEFCFTLAIAVCLIPIEWVAAWMFAVIFHEMGHYAAIKLCSGKVYDVTIGFSGAAMRIDIPNDGAELICAISGPACGALLVLLGKWFPRLAVCAFVQTAYNFLPVSGLDGWRVLRCILKKFFGDATAKRIIIAVEWIVIFGVFMLSIIISIWFRWAAVMVVGAALLAAKAAFIKIPCKQRKQIVQ